MSDAYSVTSQSLQSLQSMQSRQSLQSTPSYISQQRRTFCCTKPTYTKSCKALDRLLKSRNDLGIMEVELERERSKGRYLIVACIVMILLCGVLFEDKWPEDWRGKLIDILEKGRPESAGNTPNGVSAEKSHEKHKNNNIHLFTSAAAYLCAYTVCAVFGRWNPSGNSPSRSLSRGIIPSGSCPGQSIDR